VIVTQQIVLVVLRVALGWHLFLQGYGKFIAHSWTSKGYLAGATGPLAAWFRGMAESPWWVTVSDQVTIWGLMVLGMLLVLGLFSRLAALAGAALLSSFYLAAPPIPYGMLAPGIDGHEWYVNKLLLEVLALVVVAVFPTGRLAGLDVLWPERSGWRAGGRAV
jgi:thiosulfate dehydrogenase [quinone] large subunit